MRYPFGDSVPPPIWVQLIKIFVIDFVCLLAFLGVDHSHRHAVFERQCEVSLWGARIPPGVAGTDGAFRYNFPCALGVHSGGPSPL